MEELVCPVCGNKDQATLRQVNNVIVCRKCIRYQRAALMYEEISSEINVSDYQLDFPLSDKQKEVSCKVVEALRNGHDVLLLAVCGAGKTEMMMDAIAYTLNNNGKVGFLIPRRQVVLEVAARLQHNFIHATVVPVCQGYQQQLDGDIIVATTHQAVRYPDYFDLLILDEPDAFPYKDNKVLEAIVAKCKRKNMIYSTATPSKQLLAMVERNELVKVELNSRYTNKPMIVPVNIICFKPILWGLLIKDILIAKRSVLVFVPTIKLAQFLAYGINLFRSCGYVTSKSENKEEVIEAFRNKKFPVLIATSILERGVTFKDIDVLILYADHKVFDQAALIQMAGRVGRDMKYYQGRCIFYSISKNSNVIDCIERIKYANESLSMVQ